MYCLYPGNNSSNIEFVETGAIPCQYEKLELSQTFKKRLNDNCMNWRSWLGRSCCTSSIILFQNICVSHFWYCHVIVLRVGIIRIRIIMTLKLNSYKNAFEGYVFWVRRWPIQSYHFSCCSSFFYKNAMAMYHAWRIIFSRNWYSISFLDFVDKRLLVVELMWHWCSFKRFKVR